MTSWKEALRARVRPDWAEEIDVFERQIELRKSGKMEEKLFAETRLRRGAYGQRYDNGQRHDGIDTRKLAFPSGDLTKGPDTMWDAPGMQRIKIPFGKLNAEQMEVLADLSEEYSDAICHVTTRQDIQLHYVHIDDTPDIMRRLAAVGITTREACGNSVRNVTACHIAGVCRDEGFDVTPYAKATTFFLLGHPDTQNFGRKFKIAFSGCRQHACGLVFIHDMGLVAKTREVDGKVQRGFEVLVGGGLGAVPYQAKTLYEFLPDRELLPMCQAVSRGEKDNRARARIKFLVAKLGVDEFRRLVEDERAQLREDPRWVQFIEEGYAYEEGPLREGKPLPEGQYSEAFQAWRRTNTEPQRQPGYVVATVKLPLGDLSANQMRALADMARKYTRETVRTTIEQNIVFRWVSEADLPEFYEDLVRADLAEDGANTISDVVSCPGTDTCKLGISASRGLAAELHERLHQIRHKHAPEVEALRIKASGCFNSCGQHHVADIGFLGVGRKVGNHRMPHFQLVVGGQWRENGGAYGLAVGAVPSKRVPDVVTRLTDTYLAQRTPDESFQAFIARIGKAQVRELIKDLIEAPSFEEAPDLYKDWGDPRLYTTGDMGVGECAGQVVSFVQFGLAAAERISFDAQLALERGQHKQAAELAFKAMLEAAKALTRERDQNLSDDPDEIVQQFRKHFIDTQLFRDPYMGDKFANFFLRRHGHPIPDDITEELAHRRVEEAQLFVDAAHACYARMDQAAAAPQPAPSAKPNVPLRIRGR
jgi:sulfite reductase (ferredoxin)